MTVFDLDPLSPNVLVGGKRPRTTLTPTIVFEGRQAVPRDQHPGGRQPGSADPERAARDDRVRQGHPEAIEAPRINSLHPFGSFDSHASEPGVLEIENRIPERCAMPSPRAGTS